METSHTPWLAQPDAILARGKGKDGPTMKVRSQCKDVIF